MGRSLIKQLQHRQLITGATTIGSIFFWTSDREGREGEQAKESCWSNNSLSGFVPEDVFSSLQFLGKSKLMPHKIVAFPASPLVTKWSTSWWKEAEEPLVRREWPWGSTADRKFPCTLEVNVSDCREQHAYLLRLVINSTRKWREKKKNEAVTQLWGSLSRLMST